MFAGRRQALFRNERDQKKLGTGPEVEGALGSALGVWGLRELTGSTTVFNCLYSRVHKQKTRRTERGTELQNEMAD
jgi:hypothetical protein